MITSYFSRKSCYQFNSAVPGVYLWQVISKVREQTFHNLCHQGKAEKRRHSRSVCSEPCLFYQANAAMAAAVKPKCFTNF